MQCGAAQLEPNSIPGGHSGGRIGGCLPAWWHWSSTLTCGAVWCVVVSLLLPVPCGLLYAGSVVNALAVVEASDDRR